MEKKTGGHLISVIVPIYNVMAYLPRCIESIQGQTFPNLQIILVDDGSTDESGRICDAYAKDDSRIEALHTANGGLVMARKAGLEAARGDYIGFVDGDDFIDANMYEEMLGRILETSADFVHTGYYMETEAGQRARMNFEDKVYTLDYDGKIRFIIRHTGIFLNPQGFCMEDGLCFKLFKAELILKAYGKVPDHQQLGEDGICLCTCVMEAQRIDMYRKAYYHYVVRDTSMSHVVETDNIVKYTGLYEALAGVFRDYGCFSQVKQELEKLIKILSISYVERCCLKGALLEKYSFPRMDKIMGKKIVIYGAGQVGQNYYTQISRYRDCEIRAWVDRDFSRYAYEYCHVQSPKELENILYDVIIIAVRESHVKNQIQFQLESMGIESNKILWEKPECII